MPAIQLTRLKSQITELNWKFSRPLEFKRGLKELFSLYSDRVFRPGKTTSFAHQMDSYHVPAVLMRQLEIELSPYCKENPSAALANAEVLLSDTYIESHQVAAALIGMTPVSESKSIKALFIKWCTPQLERQTLDVLLHLGTTGLRKTAAGQWFELVEYWISDLTPAVQAIGLRALLPAIQDVDFENLPQIYHLISPLLHESSSTLQPDLIDTLAGLAHRSEVETSFFLRQIIASQHTENTIRVIRKVLPYFGQNTQTALKIALGNLSTNR